MGTKATFDVAGSCNCIGVGNGIKVETVGPTGVIWSRVLDLDQKSQIHGPLLVSWGWAAIKFAVTLTPVNAKKIMLPTDQLTDGHTDRNGGLLGTSVVVS